MDFRIVHKPSDVSTLTLTKASATEIEKWDMVALDSGLAIKWVAASTALWYAIADAGDGETEVLVYSDPNIVFAGTPDEAFAATNRGTEVDLVGTTTQLIDLGASSTDVFKILPTDDAGTVGSSTDEVLFTINKTL